MATRGLPLLQRYTAAEIPAARALGDRFGRTRRDLRRQWRRRVALSRSEWELIPLPGRRGARSLLRAWDGRIYIGSYDLFGVLQAQPDGGLH